MGMLFQALAGGIGNAAQGMSDDIKKQEDRQFQLMLLQARQQHDEHLTNLTAQLSGANQSNLALLHDSLAVKNRQIGVDPDTGIPIYNNDDPDVKAKAVAPEDYKSQLGKENTPIGTTASGGMLYQSDLDDNGNPPAGATMNADLAKRAADDTHAIHAGQAAYWAQGGPASKASTTIQAKLDQIDAMNIPDDQKLFLKQDVITNSKIPGGAGGTLIKPLTGPQQEHLDELKRDVIGSFNAGQEDKGKAALDIYNRARMSYGEPPVVILKQPGKTSDSSIPFMKGKPGPDTYYESIDPKYQNLINQSQRKVESGNQDFNANGTPKESDMGALYAMQVMPNTAKDPGLNVKPVDSKVLASGDQKAIASEYNRVGKDYMNALLAKYNNNLPVALAAYNWGPGNVDTWLKETKGDFSKLPDETKQYVQRVGGLMQLARQARQSNEG